jgi:hypothetical protein
VYHGNALRHAAQHGVAAAQIGILDGVANMLAGATQPLAAVIRASVHQLDGAQ